MAGIQIDSTKTSKYCSFISLGETTENDRKLTANYGGFSSGIAGENYRFFYGKTGRNRNSI